MIKLLKVSVQWTLSIVAGCFTLIPEAIFGEIQLIGFFSKEVNIILVRILMTVIVLIFMMILYKLWERFNNSVKITGRNYSIKVEYGDLFKMNKCKKVIAFDECFTSKVGDAPADIKPNSICGQYIKMSQIRNMKSIIERAELKPVESRSKYQSKERYASGQLVPNGEYLLMAFAKLNKDGLGEMTYDEFLDCLSVLWMEIDKYYAQQDVCIPILGSGITRIKDTNLTSQELLDLIIGSYKLSSHKIKSPYQLHIVCKKNKDFSLSKIGDSI